jgi:hypothetical protein
MIRRPASSFSEIQLDTKAGRTCMSIAATIRLFLRIRRGNNPIKNVCHLFVVDSPRQNCPSRLRRRSRQASRHSRSLFL